MKAGDKIQSTTQCRICRQMGRCESIIIDPRDGEYPEVGEGVMLDHNNLQGHLCEGSGKIPAFQGDWMYKIDGKSRKALSTVCPGCNRSIQCVGQILMIPVHLKDGYRCNGSLTFPSYDKLKEIPDK